MIKTKNSLNIREITFISIFVSIITICSWISIPMTVPFTLQTFAIFVTIGLLERKNSFLAVLVYILLGAIGLPVFSNFKGGVSSLIGPTGGYILGFLLTTLVSGFLLEKLPNKNIFLVFSMIIGLIICYTFGTAWFIYFYTKSSGSITIFKALTLCVFPFILPDLAKIGLASIIVNKLKSKVNL